MQCKAVLQIDPGRLRRTVGLPQVTVTDLEFPSWFDYGLLATLI